MPAENSEVRFPVLLVDGVLALALGLSLFYLQGVMANPFFDVFALVGVVLLSAAVFMLVAITDFFAAVNEGIRRLRGVVFYLLATAAFATVAALLLFSSMDAMRLMMVLVVAHGLAFGTVAFVVALRKERSAFERAVLYSFGAASIAISGFIAGLGGSMNERAFVGWMGAYLCLVGAKLLFIAADMEYRKAHPAIQPPTATFARHHV